MYDAMREKQCNPILAGSISAVCSWPAGLPFDTLRVRIQCCENPRTTLGTVTMQMLRQPIKKWFIGFTATCVRAAPRYGICMFAIEKSNGYLNRFVQDD